MNKVMTSVVAFGVGMVAYNYAQKNNITMSNRQMKKIQKRITKAIF